MAIKEGNTRVSVTLSSRDLERLEYLLSSSKTNPWWNLKTKTDLVVALIGDEYRRVTRKSNEN